MPETREHAELTGRRSVTLDRATIATYDAALIATDHDAVDYAVVVKHAKLVIDTRNVCGRAGLVSDKIAKS